MTLSLELLEAYTDLIGWSKSLQDRMTLTSDLKISLGESINVIDMYWAIFYDDFLLTWCHIAYRVKS